MKEIIFVWFDAEFVVCVVFLDNCIVSHENIVKFAEVSVFLIEIYLIQSENASYNA